MLLLMFPLFLRIGEATSLSNADIKFDRAGRPCGALIRAASGPPALPADDLPYDRRPKGAKCPGGKEWAPVVDLLAADALLQVSRLPQTRPSERRLNDFIQKVAEREQWGPGWWSSHGLRHGRVQDRLRSNVPPSTIMTEGRWRSRAAFEVYLS